MLSPELFPCDQEASTSLGHFSGLLSSLGHSSFACPLLVTWDLPWPPRARCALSAASNLQAWGLGLFRKPQVRRGHSGRRTRSSGHRVGSAPGCAQGTGWSGGVARGWTGGLAGRWGGTSPRGCPGRGPGTPGSAARPSGSRRPRLPRASPLPPTLRGHGGRAECRGSTYLGGGQLQERGEQQTAEQGAHSARGGRAPGAPASS